MVLALVAYADEIKTSSNIYTILALIAFTRDVHNAALRVCVSCIPDCWLSIVFLLAV